MHRFPLDHVDGFRYLGKVDEVGAAHHVAHPVCDCVWTKRDANVVQTLVEFG